MWTQMQSVKYEAPLWQVELAEVLSDEDLEAIVDMVLMDDLEEIDRKPVMGWAPYTHIVTLKAWDGEETYKYLVAIE